MVTMKWMILVILAATVCRAQTRPGSYYGGTAAEIVSACRNISVTEPAALGDPQKLSYCTAYLEGMVDGGTFVANGDANRFPVCVPPGVTMGEVIRVVLKFADDNPEKLHWGAAPFVTLALARAYPCEKDQP